MPRDSSGNYTLPSGNPVVSGEVISSAGWGNPTMSDIATEMTASLDRNGKGGMLVPMKFSDGSAPLPAITFTSEPTSGLYREASSDLEMSVSGVSRMKWTGTGVSVWDSFNSVWVALADTSGTTFFPTTGGTIDGNLEVDGDLSVTGTIEFGSLAITGTFDVDGAVELGATLHAVGAVDFDSTLNVDGALTVAGASTLAALTASGAVDLNTTLNVDGASTLVGAVTVNGDLTLSLAVPQIIILETDQAADEKQWRFLSASKTLYLRAYNDANNAHDILRATRSSAHTISTMQYGNNTDYPAHTFYGAVSSVTAAHTAELGFRGIPTASVTSGAPVATDAGKIVRATAGVTIPNSIFSSTDVLTIYNTTAGNITITASISTLRLAGTATLSHRTLAQKGLATVFFLSGTEAVISGTGLS